MSNSWKAKCVKRGSGAFWNIGDIIVVEDDRFQYATNHLGETMSMQTERLRGDRFVGITDLNFKIAGEWELIEQTTEQHDAINPITPAHYNSTKISAFDVIDDWELNFYSGNVVKYIQRAGKKENNSELQDLKKAQRYLEKQIELLEGM